MVQTPQQSSLAALLFSVLPLRGHAGPREQTPHKNTARGAGEACVSTADGAGPGLSGTQSREGRAGSPQVAPREGTAAPGSCVGTCGQSLLCLQRPAAIKLLHNSPPEDRGDRSAAGCSVPGGGWVLSVQRHQGHTNQRDQVISQGLHAQKSLRNAKIRSAPIPSWELEAGKNHPLPLRCCWWTRSRTETSQKEIAGAGVGDCFHPPAFHPESRESWGRALCSHPPSAVLLLLERSWGDLASLETGFSWRAPVQGKQEQCTPITSQRSASEKKCLITPHFLVSSTSLKLCHH